MAKRNQLNRTTLSTVPNLTTTTLTATTIDGAKHCSAANIHGDSTFTMPTNVNQVVVYQENPPCTGSIDWTAFKYAQPYTICNLGGALMVSGAVSSSTSGLAGVAGVGIQSTPLNDYTIPAATFVEGMAYPPGTKNAGGQTLAFTYLIYNSGSITV
jgi:hypothetical protein